MRKDTSKASWVIWIQHSRESIASVSPERYAYAHAYTTLRKMTSVNIPYAYGVLYRPE